MDQDGDGRVSPQEKDRYFADRARRLAEAWEVTTAEGERLRPVFARVELGHSLTQSYRFTIATSAQEILFVDSNFSHKPGQIAIVSGSGLQAKPRTPTDLSHAERVSVAITRTGK